jgi:hypothetical protein
MNRWLPCGFRFVYASWPAAHYNHRGICTLGNFEARGNPLQLIRHEISALKEESQRDCCSLAYGFPGPI